MVKDRNWDVLIKLLTQISQKQGIKVDWTKFLKGKNGGGKNGGVQVTVFRTT